MTPLLGIEAMAAWADIDPARIPELVKRGVFPPPIKFSKGAAVDWGYIATNPAKGKITMPRIPQSRAAAFSERDEEKLLAYLRGEG